MSPASCVVNRAYACDPGVFTRSKEATRARKGRQRSVFQDGTLVGFARERPERDRSSKMLPLSARETSVPIQRVRRSASLTGDKLRDVVSMAKLHQEKAATRVQAAARGKLVRNLTLTRLAASEQHAAIARLRARQHGASPGRGSLPSSSGILCNQRRGSVQTVKC